MIHWKNYEHKKVDGFKKFMSMNANDLTADAGKSINMIGKSITCILAGILPI
jgi:uncharacterized membrane protein